LAAVPATAICASCKPALLRSDGCGAAAVHRMHGSRDQRGFHPTASWALNPNPTHNTGNWDFPNDAAMFVAHRLKSDLSGKGPTHASIR
jgi:hypothetical protein